MEPSDDIKPVCLPVGTEARTDGHLVEGLCCVGALLCVSYRFLESILKSLKERKDVKAAMCLFSTLPCINYL